MTAHVAGAVVAVAPVASHGCGPGAQAMAAGSCKAPLLTVGWPTSEFGAMGREGADVIDPAVSRRWIAQRSPRRDGKRRPHVDACEYGGDMRAPASDHELIELARSGDESAYQSLVEQHRSELHAHCYRMLGSVHDAEDALQDAFLRAWRGLPGFQGRSSPRSWLYKIATNTCLDALAKRPRQRVLPFEYGPATEPLAGPGAPITESVWIEPYPDALLDALASPEARYEQRESVELAF